MEYTPIAQKSFGIDTVTGLEKRLYVWQQVNDVKSQKIVVVFDIVLISPTGKVVSTLSTGTFERINIPETNTHLASPKFDDLRKSPIGQGISGLIAKDLEDIKSFETLHEDLAQKVELKPIEE